MLKKYTTTYTTKNSFTCIGDKNKYNISIFTKVLVDSKDVYRNQSYNLIAVETKYNVCLVNSYKSVFLNVIILFVLRNPIDLRKTKDLFIMIIMMSHRRFIVEVQLIFNSLSNIII